MPSVTVKNIPDHMFNILKQIAIAHRRSMNNEIIHLIETATVSKPFNPDHFIIQAKRSRHKTKDFLLTADILQDIKNEGRP